MLTFINIPSARSWRRYFKTLNLHSDLLEGLKSINILAPTEIQRKAFPYIKEKDSVLVVSEPGSGKTLSYLVPIIDEYKKKFSTESSLFGLVFVPTTELAEQVTKVIKSLSHCVKIKSVFFRPTLPAATFLKRLEKDSPQLVVTTPFHFLKAIEKGAFKPFAKLRYVVVDETDSLIRDDFGRVMQKIFTLIKGSDFALN